MMHNVVYIAKYSPLRMFIAFILLYPLPLYLVIGSSIDLFIASKYINSLSLFLVSIPLVYILIDSLLTRQLVFYSDMVSKKMYIFDDIDIEYGGGYIVCPNGMSRFLSSAYHIRGHKYSLLHRIVFMMFFFSKETQSNVKNIISFLTGDSHQAVREFTQTELLDFRNTLSVSGK